MASPQVYWRSGLLGVTTYTQALTGFRVTVLTCRGVLPLLRLQSTVALPGVNTSPVNITVFLNIHAQVLAGQTQLTVNVLEVLAV